MAFKDWTGNIKTTFVTIGASNHCNFIRQEHDFYATDPKAAEHLLNLEPGLNNIWECACGEGHLAKVFENAGKLGLATDLVNRGYGQGGIDFLKNHPYSWNGDIVTNPPYKYALEFTQKALNIIPEGKKVCMFLKLTFLESKARKKFFQTNPPKTIYVSSSRLHCAMNGDFIKYKNSNAVAYAWYIWEKGYKGDTSIKWFN